jgi:hypothetical protein
VLAKLGAATAMAGVFLAATLPLALWCAAEGGVGAWPLAVAYLLLLATSVVLAAVGLAASALIRRGPLAAVAAYAVVFALTIGSPIVFGLSFVSASERGFEVGWRWVLLAPDPVVVLADAVPSHSPRVADPLGYLGTAVRDLRREGPYSPGSSSPPLWPTGLALQLALAAAGTGVAIRRLRVPARRLAPGERVA